LAPLGVKWWEEEEEEGRGGGGGGRLCVAWRCRLVEARAVSRRLVLRLDALGVRLLAGRLVPVVAFGGEGGGGRGVDRQQVEGARHGWRAERRRVSGQQTANRFNEQEVTICEPERSEAETCQSPVAPPLKRPLLYGLCDSK